MTLEVYLGREKRPIVSGHCVVGEENRQGEDVHHNGEHPFRRGAGSQSLVERVLKAPRRRCGNRETKLCRRSTTFPKVSCYVKDYSKRRSNGRLSKRRSGEVGREENGGRGGHFLGA